MSIENEAMLFSNFSSDETLFDVVLYWDNIYKTVLFIDKTCINNAYKRLPKLIRQKTIWQSLVTMFIDISRAMMHSII